ncbi:MAG TPA: DUF4430 domain-containing protein [Solirubrobacterales bacterium]
MRHRLPAVASALLLAVALAAAGCGFGAGKEVGEVSLTVTRDYGADRVLPLVHDGASESDTVMRVLDRNAAISTRYGGGFVRSIDGLSEATHDGRRYDWFYYVNGVESPVGAADLSLQGGEAIWWDYRNWSAASRVPAVVGSWPHPMIGGYEGEVHPVTLECREAVAACTAVRGRLEAAGIALAPRGKDGAIRVLVGSWARLREDPAVAQLEEGPGVSGVFADFVPRPRGGYLLAGLDEDGRSARDFGPGAGLVAATRLYDAPPVWIVSGTTARAVTAAAGLLDATHLRDRYAVATDGGGETPLPLRAR